jgi:hypothetical protein
VTPEQIASAMHDAARRIAQKAENERQAAARDRLTDDETERADCCEEMALSGLALRGKRPELRWCHQIRRLLPTGKVTVSPIRFCPFCGVRYHPEAGA